MIHAIVSTSWDNKTKNVSTIENQQNKLVIHESFDQLIYIYLYLYTFY